MRAPKYNPDELRSGRNAPVPGFKNLRADEAGRLWKWNGAVWERFGAGAGPRTAVRDDAGKKTAVKKCRLVCAAWHGAPQGRGWSVRFLDGDRTNLKPRNLAWCPRQRTGMPRRLSLWDQEDIRERAEAGETLTALAAEFGVSVATASNICKDYQPGGPSVAATAWLAGDERAELVRQRRAGRKELAVAVRFKRSLSRVSAIMREERAKGKE